MKIYVYTLCYNEEKFLPYYLRWYTSFCEKVIIYDNYSTDKSVKIIKSFPNTEVRYYDSGGKFDDECLVKIKDNCWKESKADYVFIIDIDEILYHPNIIQYLKENQQYSIFRLPEFEMTSKIYPRKDDFIHNIIKYGVPRSLGKIARKKCIFDPKRIEEINYERGCHRSNPKGDINISEPDKTKIKFLHYKYLSEKHYVNCYLKYRHERCCNNLYIQTLNEKILQEKFRNLYKRRIKVL